MRTVAPPDTFLPCAVWGDSSGTDGHVPRRDRGQGLRGTGWPAAVVRPRPRARGGDPMAGRLSTDRVREAAVAAVLPRCRPRLLAVPVLLFPVVMADLPVRVRGRGQGSPGAAFGRSVSLSSCTSPRPSWTSPSLPWTPSSCVLSFRCADVRAGRACAPQPFHCITPTAVVCPPSQGKALAFAREEGRPAEINSEPEVNAYGMMRAEAQGALGAYSVCSVITSSDVISVCVCVCRHSNGARPLGALRQPRLHA